MDPVIKVTGWQEIRRRALASNVKSKFCFECGDEHAYKFVGSAEKLAGDYPGLLKLPGDGRSVAYYPQGGRPCWCWVDWEGNPISFRESGQSDTKVGLRDMTELSGDGPMPGSENLKKRLARDGPLGVGSVPPAGSAAG